MTVLFEPVPAPTWSTAAHGPVGALQPVVALLARPGVTPLARPVLVGFAADHGSADLGVSAHPAALSHARIGDLTQGAGPVASAAADARITVRAVDLTTRSGDWTASGRIDTEDALTDGDLDRALQAGRDAADRAVDEGADLLLPAVLSVGVSTPAAVLTAAVTGMEPVDATTRGSGIDDAAWIRKCAAVRDALRRCTLAGTDVRSLLRTAGGADLAAMTGFIAQAAVRATPVLVDDVSSTLSAVLAHRLAPGADGWIVAAARHQERPHGRLLDVLGKEPLTDWRFRAGQGLGSIAAVAVLRLAVAASAGSAEPLTENAVADWDPELL